MKRKIKSNLIGELKPKSTRVVFSTALGIVILFGLGAVTKTQAATINVPSDYATIQGAVDAANPGDTIEVAEGEYAGAAIVEKSVEIHGSGPSTRITTIVPAFPPFGSGFFIFDATDVEVSNLAIEFTAIKFYDAGIWAYKADNVTVRDVTVKVTCSETDPFGGGILCENSSNPVITGNTISGSYGWGIWPYQSPDAIISSNTISGSGRVGIFVKMVSDYTTITKNTIVDFRTSIVWGSPICIENSQNCIVTNNELINVYDPDNYAQGNGPIAGIRVSGWNTVQYPCANNTIQQNDYSESGLPGFTTYVDGQLAGTDEPGCILLENGSCGNQVHESLMGNKFPPGTMLCNQIIDLTIPPIPGSLSYNVATGIYTMEADGTDIWGTADECHYAYMPLSGDGEIVVKVLSLEYTHYWAKAGVMIRETLEPGSKHAMTVVTPAQGVSFQSRISTDGASTHTTTAGIVAPQFVKLVRVGDTFTGYNSGDGVTWVPIGNITVPMTENVNIGLALTSHNAGVMCTAVFSDVSINGVEVEPEAWANQDINSYAPNKITGYSACVNNPNWQDILEHLRNIPLETGEEDELY